MKSRAKIRTVIVDSSELFGKALADVINTGDIEVVGEATDEKELVNLLKSQRPDVVIYDPYDSSERFEATMGKIRQASPPTSVLVLSFENSPGIIEFCLEKGAKGFCSKKLTDISVLLATILKIGNSRVVTNSKAA